MTAKQYDCKTAWLQSGMNAKYLLTRAVYQVAWAPSLTATHTINSDSPDTLRSRYDTAGLRNNDICRFCGSRSTTKVHPRQRRYSISRKEAIYQCQRLGVTSAEDWGNSIQ